MIEVGRIVVGIDGGEAAWQALAWAAEDAEQTGRSLLVVHVGDLAGEPEGLDQRAFGRQLLDEAVATLAEEHPRVGVSTALREGHPAEVLIDVAQDADLLVVGRPRRALLGMLGAVSHRVLANGPCPIAVVGADSRGPSNKIVVGVSDSVCGRAALRFAADEAIRRGAELVAVRAWSTREFELAASAALPISSPQVWEAEERAVLKGELAVLRRAEPDVQVRGLLTSVPVEAALEAEAPDAAMLVLGCRRDTGHLLRVGPVGGWAVAHLRCPVVIVGTRQTTAAAPASRPPLASQH